MNILILTPTNEIDITLFSRKLCNDYGDTAHLFSVQQLALLADMQNPKQVKNWHAYEYAMALTTREDGNIIRDKAAKDKTPYIVFGNIPKGTLKFDHILSIAESSWDWNVEASDRATCNKIFNPTTVEIHYSPLEWYTKNDIQLTLPTYHHLQLFLKTLGIGGKKVGK